MAIGTSIQRGPTGRLRVFVIEACYLVVLAALFVAYHISDPLRDALPTTLGPLPVSVPWFGAVGATLISLTGIFKHSQDWRSDFELWHYARPLIGAFLGSVGALIFAVIVQTAVAKPLTPRSDTYAVVAFLVGYREATFRALIQRATDVLLAPAEEAKRSVVDPQTPEQSATPQTQDV